MVSLSLKLLEGLYFPGGQENSFPELSEIFLS